MKKLAKLFILLLILFPLCTGCGSWQTEADKLIGTWRCRQSVSPAFIFYANGRYCYGEDYGDYTLLPNHKLKLSPDSTSTSKHTSYVYCFALKGSTLTIFSGVFSGTYQKITP